MIVQDLKIIKRNIFRKAWFKIIFKNNKNNKKKLKNKNKAD